MSRISLLTAVFAIYILCFQGNSFAYDRAEGRYTDRSNEIYSSQDQDDDNDYDNDDNDNNDERDMEDDVINNPDASY